MIGQNLFTQKNTLSIWKSAKRGITRVLNKNAVSWQIRNNRKLPKQKLNQNAKKSLMLLKFGLIKDNRAIYTRKNKTRLT